MSEIEIYFSPKEINISAQNLSYNYNSVMLPPFRTRYLLITNRQIK